MIKHLKLKASQPQSVFPVFFVALFPLICIAMSDSAAKTLDSQAPPSPPVAAVHIVYTEKPQDEDPEAYHIRTLSAVLGRCVIVILLPGFQFFLFSFFFGEKIKRNRDEDKSWVSLIV